MCTGTEKIPCEDTVGRQSSASPGERLQKKPNPAVNLDLGFPDVPLFKPPSQYCAVKPKCLYFQSAPQVILLL